MGKEQAGKKEFIRFFCPKLIVKELQDYQISFCHIEHICHASFCFLNTKKGGSENLTIFFDKAPVEVKLH